MSTRIARVRRLCWYFCLALIDCAIVSSATAVDFSAQIKHLSKDRPRSERLEAIELLHKEFEAKGAEKAIPALAACAEEDDSFIRLQSLRVLSLVTVTRDLPCPASLVKALLDPDEHVRTVATNNVGAFKTYSKESLSIAYQALKNDDYDVRNTALDVIKGAGANDPKALAAVKEALNDKNRMVRDNAQVALWKLTGDRELKVRNLVERFVAPDPRKVSPPLSNAEICAVKLVRIGAQYGLRDMSREQPRDVAALLLKLTKDGEPSIRVVLRQCWASASVFQRATTSRKSIKRNATSSLTWASKMRLIAFVATRKSRCDRLQLPL